MDKVPASRGLGAAGSPFRVGRDFDRALGRRVRDFERAVDGEGSVGSDAGGAEDGVAGEVVLSVVMLLLSDQALGFRLLDGRRRHLVGVVAVADLTLQAEPVERSPASPSTVVAAGIDLARSSRRCLAISMVLFAVGRVFNMRHEPFEFVVVFRHRLCTDLVIQFSPLQLHVDSTFAADRTLVRDSHEIFVTFAVHVVSAR